MNGLQFLQNKCKKVDFDLDHLQLQALCRYAEELLKWSKKMNLVTRGDLQTMLSDHVLDSLCLYPLIHGKCETLLDVGTGAGLPGLVLGAVCPETQVTLIEPRAKRVSFLRHIVRNLQLTNITIIPERLEPDMALGGFSAATSRAFAELALFLPLVEPYLADGGQVLCMKGPKGDEEFRKFQKENPDSSLRLEEKVKAAYPIGDHGRCLMIVKKSF
jgi:16S rRNA (guanine527-N7)-methyltransferase